MPLSPASAPASVSLADSEVFGALLEHFAHALATEQTSVALLKAEIANIETFYEARLTAARNQMLTVTVEGLPPKISFF